MGAIASQTTSLTIVYSTVYSDADKKKTSKLRVTGLCAGNSPGTGEFPAQMASNAENFSIWWRHHDRWIPLTKVSDANFDVLFDQCLNKRLSKHSWRRWFDMPSHSL